MERKKITLIPMVYEWVDLPVIGVTHTCRTAYGI
jgi:hypothetical protein